MNGNELILLRRIEELENYIKRVPEVGGVWTAYTPTITYAGGTTDPTTTTVAGKYCVIGKVCIEQITYQITTIGSGDRRQTSFSLAINYSGSSAVAAAQSSIVTALGTTALCLALCTGGTSVTLYHGAMDRTGVLRTTIIHEIA